MHSAELFSVHRESLDLPLRLCSDDKPLALAARCSPPSCHAVGRAEVAEGGCGGVGEFSELATLTVVGQHGLVRASPAGSATSARPGVSLDAKTLRQSSKVRVWQSPGVGWTILAVGGGRRVAVGSSWARLTRRHVVVAVMTQGAGFAGWPSHRLIAHVTGAVLAHVLFSSMYVPAGQATQLEEEELTYPKVQEQAVELSLPSVSVDMCAGQLVQTDIPTSSAKVPREHATQASFPIQLLYLPS
eukprot:746377-Hanusia_phi.AAC.5